MINRLEKIRQQASYKNQFIPTNFSKIRVGGKTLQDAILNLGDLKRVNPNLADKQEVLQAINSFNISKIRQISLFFYRSSGIYARLCRYMAYLYRYDWFVTPFINGCQGLLDQDSGVGNVDTEQETKNRKKQFNNFFKVLRFLQYFEIKKFCGEVALKVIKYGVYYGYLIYKGDRVTVQELPIDYCRSRFSINNRPVIEFNMKYFRDTFSSQEQREQILKIFPEEFTKGYKLLKNNNLPPCFPGDDIGWYLLDYKSTIKFNINDQDYPPFISVIPAIIDLDKAQDLDRKKMAQKLLKIIVQKIPLDKNGDLNFDPDEITELHNNAVKMLSRAIGVDVLTTFAEVDVADMSQRSATTTSADELKKVERGVFNEAGVSQLQFNSDGNVALNNSILNDEASMYNLLLQFESFLNLLLVSFNKSPKKCYYQAQFLTTTIYNYKEVSKLYKQQAQMGYNKMLPQVALGQTQSSILANAYFENDILDLVRVFIPPLTSNTMNAEALQNRGATSGASTGKGRPQKEDNQKAEKTIQNKQSM